MSSAIPCEPGSRLMPRSIPGPVPHTPERWAEVLGTRVDQEPLGERLHQANRLDRRLEEKEFVAELEARSGGLLQARALGRKRTELREDASAIGIGVGVYCPEPDMNWKTKCLIQRACAALPIGKESAYYFLQSNFGAGRFPPNPMPNLREMATIASDLASLGFSIEGKRVMEVGTGRRLDMPMAFYLLGAASVITVDLRRYLRYELVPKSLLILLKAQDEVRALFEPFVGKTILDNRLEKLASLQTAAEIMNVAGIQYKSPADASRTDFPDGSIDLQFSYTVFEHIPGPVLIAILRETNRILSPRGLACHHIDPSDHFSHDDQSISQINFLHYEEEDWSYYNDNQFAYHNRLRVTDFDAIYHEVGHEKLLWRTWKDQRSLKELSEGMPLALPYRNVDPEILATTVVRAITRPNLPLGEGGPGADVLTTY